MSKSWTLLKVGDEQNILELFEFGTLYMNPLSYFWGIEDGNVRGDPNEGLEFIQYGEQAEIRDMEGNVIPVTVTAWTLRVPHPESHSMNIFCMTRFGKDTPFNEQGSGFGDTVLVITNPIEFLKRIDEMMKRESLEGMMGPVEYVADDHAGELGPLRKLMRYAWQEEWRLIVKGGSGVPRRLSLGCLRDIAVIIHRENVNRLIECTELPEGATLQS